MWSYLMCWCWILTCSNLNSHILTCSHIDSLRGYVILYHALILYSDLYLIQEKCNIIYTKLLLFCLIFDLYTVAVIVSSYPLCSLLIFYSYLFLSLILCLFLYVTSFVLQPCHHSHTSAVALTLYALYFTYVNSCS